MKCLQDQNLTVNFKLNKTVTVERVIFWYWTWETKYFFYEFTPLKKHTESKKNISFLFLLS